MKKNPRQTGFGPLAAALLAAACTPTRTAPAAILYMVTARKVPLYQGQLITETLFAGEIVRGRPHSVQNVWIDLVWNGKRYNALRAYFASRAELDMKYSAREAKLQTEIDRLTDQIRQNEQSALDRFAAAAAARADAAVRYRSWNALTPAPAAPAAQPTFDAAAPTPYTYTDRLPPGRAENLARSLEKETQSLDRYSARLREKRRSTAAKLAQTQAQAKIVQARFDRVARTGKDDLNRLFITVDDRVRLFQNTRLKLELRRGTVVRAVRHRVFTGWLRVFYLNAEYAARARHFRPWTTLAIRHARQNALAAWRERDDSERIRFLQARRDLLDSLKTQLRYRYNLQPPPFTACSWPNGFTASNFYTPGACPAGAVAFVDPARARTAIRRWELAITDLDNEIRALRKDAARSRKTRLVADALYRAQIRRFSAVLNYQLPSAATPAAAP